MGINNMSAQSGKFLLSGNEVAAEAVTFANSDAKDTTKNIEIDTPANPLQAYIIGVANPSTATALTVKLFNVRNSVRYYLTSLAVPAATATIAAYDFLVQGLFVGDSLSIDVSNDTAIGSSGTFSAGVKMLEA